MNRNYINTLGAALLCVVTSCSLINSIDVCDRGVPEEHQINRYTAGAQAIQSPRALVMMPSGQAFLAFSSQIHQGGDDVPQHVRGTLIDSEGEPLATCGESQGYAYAPENIANTEGRHRYAPVVVAPKNDSEVGLVVYMGEEPGVSGQSLYALQLDAAGCPALDEFRIDNREGFSLAGQVVVSMGEERFIVLWAALGDVTSIDESLRARVIQGRRFDGAIFLPTLLSEQGDPVTLSPRGHMVISVDAVNIEEGRVAVVWQTWRDATLRTWFAIYDDRLDELVAPTELEAQPNLTTIPLQSQVVIANGNGSMLVTWEAFDEVERPRINALLITPDGIPIGEPFYLGDGTAEEELRAASVASTKGTLVVVWDALGSASHPDRDERGIRLLAMTSEGERRFVNPVCGAGTFQVNRGVEGSQSAPNLAFFPDGALLVVWNDDGQNGIDISGHGIRGSVWPERLLFPVE